MPVASDVYALRQRAQQSGGSLDVNAEKSLQEAWGLARYRPVGLDVISPDGRVIVADHASRDPAVMRRFVANAVALAGVTTIRRLPPTPAAPDRGVGIRRDGSARLAVTVRATQSGRPANQTPIFDSLYLDSASLRALAPPQVQSGARYSIPRAVASQFAIALTDGSDPFYVIRPNDLTKVTVEAEVTSVNAGIVTVRLSGQLAGTRVHAGQGRPPNIGSADLDGYLTLDSAGRIHSCLIVTNGESHGEFNRTPHETAGLIEWKSGGASLTLR